MAQDVSGIRLQTFAGKDGEIQAVTTLPSPAMDLDDSDAIDAKRKSVKIYNITDTKLFNSKHQEIKNNGQAIYWVETSAFWNPVKTPILTLHSQSSTGPVVAASKIGYFGWDCSITLGDHTLATTDGKDRWTKLERLGTLKTAFYFYCGGKTYLWKRTHDHNLGATKRSNKDFKLIQCAERADAGRLLAVVTWEKGKWKPTRNSMRDAGKIDWFEELGQELEALALVSILGTVLRMRRNEAYAAASSSGGGN